MPKFEKGPDARRGKGGKRSHAGRKPDLFKAKCAELACSAKFFEFAKDVFANKDVEPRLTKDGDVITMPASVEAKTYLWDKLAEWGFGKALKVQALDKDGNPAAGGAYSIVVVEKSG